MSDRACPIGECTGTVAFETAVVEVTPRYQLHDLTEVDEFVECPSCEAEVAGFYEEGEENDDHDGTNVAGDDGVELILDIDDESGSTPETEADAFADESGSTPETEAGAFADDDASADESDSTLEDDGFDDPDAVLEAFDFDDEDDEDGDDDHEPVFG